MLPLSPLQSSASHGLLLQRVLEHQRLRLLGPRLPLQHPQPPALRPHLVLALLRRQLLVHPESGQCDHQLRHVPERSAGGHLPARVRPVAVLHHVGLPGEMGWIEMGGSGYSWFYVGLSRTGSARIDIRYIF